jgi:hypothetical protein
MPRLRASVRKFASNVADLNAVPVKEREAFLFAD